MQGGISGYLRPIRRRESNVGVRLYSLFHSLVVSASKVCLLGIVFDLLDVSGPWYLNAKGSNIILKLDIINNSILN
jgi:hypothetical protein